MAAWPDSLPCLPIAETFSFAPVPNMAEFKPELPGVAPIRRRRYTHTNLAYRGSMRLRGAQVETLKSFFADDLFDGVLSFTMRDWRVAFTSGTDVDGTFQFVEEPTYQHAGVDRFIVSLTLSKID